MGKADERNGNECSEVLQSVRIAEKPSWKRSTRNIIRQGTELLFVNRCVHTPLPPLRDHKIDCSIDKNLHTAS